MREYVHQSANQRETKGRKGREREMGERGREGWGVEGERAYAQRKAVPPGLSGQLQHVISVRVL